MAETDVLRVLLCAGVLGMYCYCLITAVRMLYARVTGSRGPAAVPAADADRRSDLRLFLVLLAVVVLSRMLQYLIGHVMAYGLDLSGFGLDSMQRLWVRSDAPHYLGIADYGYRTVGDPRFHIVFFPFYPILVHAVSALTGHTFAASLVVSNLALTGACFYLYKLALMDSGAAGARRTVKYLLLFPAAFFLGAGFSESLFIFFAAASMYYARKDRLALAAGLAAAAAFTRMLGVLLVIPVVFEACENSGAFDALREKGFKKALGLLSPRAAWALLVPAGTFAYLLVNKAVTGDWFRFLVYQREHWYQQFGLFFLNAGTIYDQFALGDMEAIAFLWIPELVCIVLSLALMVRTFKTQRASYAFFSLAYFLVAIAPTWLLSAPRYIMAMVPLHFMLREVTIKRWADALLTAAFGAAQLYMMWGFVNGMYIY